MSAPKDRLMDTCVDSGGAPSKRSLNYLFQVTEGVTDFQHYGLELARYVGLPTLVLKIAEEVSSKVYTSNFS